MKRHFRIILAGALALVMLLSLASCAKLEMDDVEDALEEYAEDNEDKYEFEKVSKEDIIKVANSISVNTVYFLKDNGSAKEGN